MFPGMVISSQLFDRRRAAVCHVAQLALTHRNCCSSLVMLVSEPSGLAPFQGSFLHPDSQKNLEATPRSAAKTWMLGLCPVPTHLHRPSASQHKRQSGLENDKALHCR